MTNPNDPTFTTSEIVQFNSGPALATMGGLTKREYFAALAMQALVSNSSIFDFFQRAKISPKEVREETGKTAVQFADALIEALNK